MSRGAFWVPGLEVSKPEAPAAAPTLGPRPMAPLDATRGGARGKRAAGASPFSRLEPKRAVGALAPHTTHCGASARRAAVCVLCTTPPAFRRGVREKMGGERSARPQPSEERHLSAHPLRLPTHYPRGSMLASWNDSQRSETPARSGHRDSHRWSASVEPKPRTLALFCWCEVS